MSLDGVPLIISGMASSSLGMLELPYKEFPFSADGSDLRTEAIGASAAFKHDVLLISGACTRIDVMRGEETQLVGCAPGAGHGSGNPGPGGEQVYIFPGTHSKHVLVREGRAVSLKTFMTGEFFDLLSTKSILAGDVAVPGAGGRGEGGQRGEMSEEGKVSEQRGTDTPAEALRVGGKEVLLTGDRLSRFEEGVRSGVENNLLHGSFLVRTNRLLRGMSKEDNYYYLSGLLIGAELKELAGIGMSLTIVGSGLQQEYYKAALRQLGMREVRVLDGGEAVLRGQRGEDCGRKRRYGLMFKDRPQDNDDHRHQEHKYGDAVDAMHIFDPSAPRSIRVFFLNVEIFRYLSPYSHTVKIIIPQILEINRRCHSPEI